MRTVAASVDQAAPATLATANESRKLTNPQAQSNCCTAMMCFLSICWLSRIKVKRIKTLTKNKVSTVCVIVISK
ncbi:hypothetical protein RAG73_27160 [Klebsiella pneumoniae]